MKNQTLRAMLTTAVMCAGLLTFGPAHASAASCSEITQAIAWNQQSTAQEHYPVMAYMTKHYGAGLLGQTYPRDTVHYAAGDVYTTDMRIPSLAGTLLSVSANTTDSTMGAKPTLSYAVEIFANGTLRYVMQVNNKPVGGLPPKTVQATCVNNRLLTAMVGSEVITIGVAIQPPRAIPH
jgi:hypothetical protein